MACRAWIRSKQMNFPSKSRVLGYVMARNEWPLLGLSVMHAINSGIDRIVIIDHCSDDATREGLRVLKSFCSDKIVVCRVDDPRYLQEATSALVMALVDADSYDWVYAFDADEFVLLPPEMKLGEMLSRVSLDIDAVRYEIHQWVAPTDFDDLDITEYSRIRYRAVANNCMKLAGEDLGDEIEHGNVNFFDLPFPSKVIVRGNRAQGLVAGAHLIREEAGTVEMTMVASTLRVGHLPLLSRRRLALKSEQGAALIRAGFDSGHGWQSQMIHRLDIAETLDDFWHNHSLTDDLPHQFNGSFPVTVVDESLAQAINIVITQLGDLDAEASENSQSSDSLGLSQGDLWSGAISSINRQIKTRDGLVVERDGLVVERDGLVVERDGLVVERDGLVVERDALVIERDARIAGLALEIERLQDRYRAAESDLDVHRQEMTKLTSSKAFRLGMFITWPARHLRSAIAALKQRA
jgi:hypothetical protein